MSNDAEIPGLTEDRSYYKCWTKFRLMLRYGARCFYCERPIPESVAGWFFMTLDHWDPKLREGRDEFSNLRLACRSCNSVKWHKQLHGQEFREEMQRAAKATDRWIGDYMTAIKSLSASSKKPEDLGDPRDLAADLERLLNTPPWSETFRAGRPPKLRKRDDVIQLVYNDREWRFEAADFTLLAYFMDSRTYGEHGRELEARGFFRWKTGHGIPYKNLPPFFDADEGIERIRQEVKEVERILEGPPEGAITSGGGRGA